MLESGRSPQGSYLKIWSSLSLRESRSRSAGPLKWQKLPIRQYEALILILAKMVKFAKQLGSSLLLLFSAAVAEEATADEPQQMYNTSLHIPQEGILNTRDLFGLEPRAYTCRSGYSECAYDTSRCCPSGTSCCGTGYCADPGDTCCTTGGTCPSGWNCCGDACSPVDGECCNGGYYCRAGKHCRIYNGEKVCCPSSGCSGESDSGSLGGTVTAVATVTATTTSRTTSTYQRTYADYSYYSTTYYW